MDPTLEPTVAPTINPSPAPTTIETDDGYLLILQHRNASAGKFNITLTSTGLENVNDPDANTYSIIGGLDPDNYRFDGAYWFRLIYDYDDGSNTTLEWSQTSWLNETNITGANLYNVPNQTAITNPEAVFKGMGKSILPTYAYLDGDGGEYAMFWNAVGSTGYSFIPAFNFQNAYSQRFYVSTSGTTLSFVLPF